MIAFACSQCGKKLSVRDDLAGRTGHCPACRRRMTVPAPRRASPSAEDGWAEIGNDRAAPAPPHGPPPEAAARPAGAKAHSRSAGAHGPHAPKARGALVWGGRGLAVGLLLGVFVGLAGGVYFGFVLWGSPGPQAPAGDATRALPGKAAARETPRAPAERAEPEAVRPDRDQGKKPPATGNEREAAPQREKEAAREMPRPPADSPEPVPAPSAKERPNAPEPEAKPKERSSATGFVAGVEKEDDHVLLLLRSEESTMANYHCYFAPSRAGEVGRLKEGEKVRVRGVVESRDFPVVLKECELVK